MLSLLAVLELSQHITQSSSSQGIISISTFKPTATRCPQSASYSCQLGKLHLPMKMIQSEAPGQPLKWSFRLFCCFKTSWNSRVWQLIHRGWRRDTWPLMPVGQHQPSPTHQLVLISSDGSEDGLDEDKGAELLRLEVEQRGGVVLLLDDVDPRLVLVHGVEDNLWSQHQW